MVSRLVRSVIRNFVKHASPLVATRVTGVRSRKARQFLLECLENRVLLFQPDSALLKLDYGSVQSDSELTARLNGPRETPDVGDTIALSQNSNLGPGVGSYAFTAAIGNGTQGTKDVDVYRFSAGFGSSVTITTSLPSGGVSMDSILRLFDSLGNELAFNDDSSGLYSQIQYTFNQPGTFYIGVSGYSNSNYNPNVAGSGISGSTGDYTLLIQLTSNDLGDTLAAGLNTLVGPAPGTYATATFIGDGLQGQRDVDVFRFSAAAGTTLTATTALPLGGTNLDTVVRLFDAVGTQLDLNDNAGTATYSRLQYNFSSSGTYYLGVSGSANTAYNPNLAGSGIDGSIGSYSLTLQIAATPQGSVQGLKWSDHDIDGVRDAGEPGISGVTLYVDSNSNGQFDFGEPSAVSRSDNPLTTSIDETGTYEIVNVPLGQHVVREIVPNGYQQTYPVLPPAAGFQIEVVFPDSSLTPSQKAIFSTAAARWAQIITGDLPQVGLIDDVRIEATAPFIDGVGSILGQAGPTSLRNGSQLPYAGIMEFDSADVASLESQGTLDEVILHEMGHVLGIGTIWSSLGLLDSNATNPRFLGVNARTEYNSIFGVSEASVPVENDGGPGTALGHWEESNLRNGLTVAFNNELMTGFLNGSSSPISRVTVASLQDIGYQVNLAAADPFVPSAPSAPAGSELRGFVANGRIVALQPEQARAVQHAARVKAAEGFLENSPSSVVADAWARLSDLSQYTSEELQSAKEWAVLPSKSGSKDFAKSLAGVREVGDVQVWSSGSTGSPASILEEAKTAGSIEAYYPLIVRQQTPRLTPNDPFFPNQWHLRNVGQSGGFVDADANVTPAWDSVTGNGVLIGIVDDGLQFTHPDLDDRYSAADSFDFNDNDPIPSPTSADRHGTSAAGVAAAAFNNNTGVSGSAPNAGLAGLRLIAAGTTDAQEAAALSYASQNIDIYSNSWGPTDDAQRLEAPGPLTLQAFQNSVTNGRGGLGNIYSWAAGNGLANNDNVNYDGYANSRYVVAVAAVDHFGRQAWYSEPGAPILVTAPSSGGAGIVTTDLLGPDGYGNSSGFGNDYTDNFGGTSSATPLVSGVVALMLEANPNLTWRDVQHILVRSSVKNDLAGGGWRGNGAGRLVSHKYGFGMVNAKAAVDLARTWRTVAAEQSYDSGLINVGTAIPDNNTTGVTSTIAVAQNLNIEAVEVVFTAGHVFRGNLRVVLTAPSGLQSVLAESHADSGDNYTSWVFSSKQHWDESSQGNWTLNVTDPVSGNTGTFNSWRLRIYGTQPQAGSSATPDNGYWAVVVGTDSGATGVNFGNQIDIGETMTTAMNTGVGTSTGAFAIATVLGDGPHGLKDVDLYRFDVAAGSRITFATTENLGFAAMDTMLRLFDSFGNQLALDDDSGPGAFSLIDFTFSAAGTYYAGVTGYDNAAYSVLTAGSGVDGATGSYKLTINLAASATVTDRQVFYNRSTSAVFGNGTGNPTTSIDPGKSALLPGQTATFSNVTNYSRGLNGLLVDLLNGGWTVTAADFQFATGNGSSPLTFTTLTATPTVTVIPNGGSGGANRVKIEFADNDVKNTWLRVTILANANTGLASNDVFYFGNAVGEMNVGNIGSPVVLRTNASDTGTVRQNQSATFNSVGISSLHDIDKDGRVNATDTGLVRQNQTPNGSITLFTAPAALMLADESSVVDAALADVGWLDDLQSTDGKSRFTARRR